MEFAARTPFFRFLIPFALGTSLSYLKSDFTYLNREILSIVFCIILVFFIILMSVKRLRLNRYSWVYGICISMILFLFGVLNVLRFKDVFRENFYANYFSQKNELLVVEITEPPQLKTNWVKIFIRVSHIFKNNAFIPVQGKSLIYVKRTKEAINLKYGDRLMVYGYFQELKPPINPKAFDFQWQLGLSNIYHQAFISEKKWEYIDNKSGNTLKRFALNAADYMSQLFKKHNLGKQEFGVVSALLIGKREEIDEEILNGYSASGAMHILSVSGLHVGIVYSALGYLFFFAKRLPYGNQIKVISTLLALWFYAILTGMSPSVMRAALMLSFVLVKELFDKRGNSFNTVCASGFLLLCYSPSLLFNIGFQLSFTAVAGIVLWHRDLYNMLEFDNRWLDSIWSLTVVSIVASLATLPFCLYYFHAFPVYFLLTNYVAIPLSSGIIFWGIGTAALSINDWICHYAMRVLEFMLFLLNKWILFIQHLPGSQVTDVQLSSVQFVLLVILVYAAVMFCYRMTFNRLAGVLCCFIVLLFVSGIKHYQTLKQRKIIVYSLGKISAIHFIKGDKDLLLASNNLLANPVSMKYNIQVVRHAFGISNFKQINIDTDKSLLPELDFYKKGSLIHFNDQTIFLIEKPMRFKSDYTGNKRAISFALVRNNSKVDTTFIRKLHTKQTLIDATNKFGFAKKMDSKLKLAGFNSLNLSETGAYMVDLEERY